eukprot:gnl/TRDRNA2_/TRDRNA2_43184_c0_seq1.p1 gnl/TRDRNA2_/TRDRNA2_43184_c0~~gnl/TRDRNA2_/TRDRNA2_43184_c0_seq1.p1  ORF type:complete len:347 (+),score=65.42 gnl/TRDRNA2_/TRDRNA2_43184_c0_seq1:69-1109(+)
MQAPFLHDEKGESRRRPRCSILWKRVYTVTLAASLLLSLTFLGLQSPREVGIASRLHPTDLENTTLGLFGLFGRGKKKDKESAGKTPIDEISPADMEAAVQRQEKEVMSKLQDPEVQAKVKEAMHNPALVQHIQTMQAMGQSEEMRMQFEQFAKDPELKSKFQEIIMGGAEAWQKYMNDEDFLQKIGKLVGDAPTRAFASASGVTAQTPPPLPDVPVTATDAVRKEDLEALKALLAKGSDPSLPDSSGRTPLHFAAALGNEEMVSVLLEAKADIKATEDQGSTPLHYAAGYGKGDAAKVLLKAGALPKRNHAHKSPADLAYINFGNPIPSDNELMKQLQCALPGSA